MADGKVGIGHPDPDHPTNKYKGDDEGRYDEEGRPVITGANWSHVPTNLYLTIFLTKLSGLNLSVDRMFHSETVELKGGELTVGTSNGKPTFQIPGFGLSLELPSDLARDELKKQYVMEWIAGTVGDVLLDSGAKVPGTTRDLDHFAAWLHDVAERAIRKVGL
jgi:hypothetical protein